MDIDKLITAPDEHDDPRVAAQYDRAECARFLPEEVDPAVRMLRRLAGNGRAVELAVGTGRLAIPLAAAGIRVDGLDASEAMLSELAKKPGAASVEITLGDMTSTRVCKDAALVYLVFNSITNLRTQALQVACFHNAAAQLQPGGRFLVECNVPGLRHLPPGETIRPHSVTQTHLGFDEYVDLARQISVSHHYFIDGDRVRTQAAAFRYVWPSELDLMAMLARLELESRVANWEGDPFTGASRRHVSVWRKI